jgi:hypothetical protein
MQKTALSFPLCEVQSVPRPPVPHGRSTELNLLDLQKAVDDRANAVL